VLLALLGWVVYKLFDTGQFEAVNLPGLAGASVLR
jgi:hypothetical protein